MNNRRKLLVALGTNLLAPCITTGVLGSGKIPRIGYIRAEPPPQADIEGFRQGLREHGYIDGKNIIVEYRWGDGSEPRLREILVDLIRLKIDLIVASAPAAVRAAKEVTTSVPIVMVTVADPVAFGFIDSLARPGGNVTGFAYLLPELSGKRLQILKDAVPGLSRVAVLWNAANSYKEHDLKEVQAVAQALMVAIQKTPVRTPADFPQAFDAAVASRSDGLITLEDPFTIANRTQIVALALKHKLPAVYGVRPFADAGGLMSYGPDRVDQMRRAAMYVDRILKGERPSALPVEQPNKFELVINLQTAKALGIVLPQVLLVRADQLIQ